MQQGGRGVGHNTWQQPLNVGTATLTAELAAPDDPLGWMLIARARTGEPPPVLRALLEELHELGVGTMAIALPPRGVPAIAGWISLATTQLRAEIGPDLPLAYLGARRHAAGGWAASLGGGLDGVIAWNAMPGRVWRQLPHVAVPSLLVVDAQARRWQAPIAAATRRRLGGSAEHARCMHHEDVAALVAWYERRLLDRVAFVACPRPRRLITVRRAAAVAGLAALPALVAPAVALPDFSSGQTLAGTQTTGSTSDAFVPAGEYKPGDKNHDRGILGDPPLTDGLGLRWNINTNVGFTTTSSASGAVSEAGFTHPVAATTLNGGTVNQNLVDAFDGYNALCVDLNNVGGQCNTANMAVYNQNGPGSLECSGRQVVLPQRTIGSFQVRRKVFVPANDGFARWLNVFRNTSATPQTLRMVTSNNLGSDAQTRIVTTSDGDATPELSDTWVTTFQNFSGTTSADPRLGHVLRGLNAPVGLAAISFVNGDDNPFWRYQFTIEPGQTAIIMNYATGQASRAAAAAQASSLASVTNPNQLACMTPTEISQVVNFFENAPVRTTRPGVVTSSTGWGLRNSLSTGSADTVFTYGTRPLVPLTGDWDGDGVETAGTFEAGTFKLRDTNSAGPPDVTVTFGDPRGFPVAGDFDGDDTDDLAVVRNGTWQIRYSGGAPDAVITFGSGTWPFTVPVAGDWDGDGFDGIGQYAAGTWSLRNSASSGPADASFVYNPGTSPYPVVGDWNNDGTDSVGVKAGSDWLLKNTNAAGAPDITFTFGLPNDFPVVWRG